jgi:predicted naringenin-chalcone synthase
LNSKIGTKLFYNETVRVCKNDCELAGKTHSDSLANSQVGLTAPSQDATLLKIVPFVATLCRAATFYVNCSTSVFDNSAQCARKILSAKQSNVSVVAGVANCLVSATKPICDWSHEINNSSSKCNEILIF